MSRRRELILFSRGSRAKAPTSAPASHIVAILPICVLSMPTSFSFRSSRGRIIEDAKKTSSIIARKRAGAAVFSFRTKSRILDESILALRARARLSGSSYPRSVSVPCHLSAGRRYVRPDRYRAEFSIDSFQTPIPAPSCP